MTEAEAKRLAASMGAECYVESSSLTQKNLKEVFDQGGCCSVTSRGPAENLFTLRSTRIQGRKSAAI